MANYEAISKNVYKDKRWKPTANFKFTGHDSLCALATLELPRAALHLPIAFSRVEDSFDIFAVQGLQSEHNDLVDAAGNWQAKYVPAIYRGYPFALGTTEDQQQVLCIDTESGLLSNTEGNQFFDDEGELSTQIRELLDFLSHIENSRRAARALCALLVELDLLEPWPITANVNGEDISIEGLFRVNERKFNSLQAGPLLELKDKGALPLIFSQLLSMQNIAQFTRQTGTPSELPDEFSFDLSNEGGNISFEGL